MAKPIYLEKYCFCAENGVNRVFMEQWQWLVHWIHHPVSQVQIHWVAPSSTQLFILLGLIKLVPGFSGDLSG